MPPRSPSSTSFPGARASATSAGARESASLTLTTISWVDVDVPQEPEPLRCAAQPEVFFLPRPSSVATGAAAPAAPAAGGLAHETLREASSLRPATLARCLATWPASPTAAASSSRSGVQRTRSTPPGTLAVRSFVERSSADAKTVGGHMVPRVEDSSLKNAAFLSNDRITLGGSRGSSANRRAQSVGDAHAPLLSSCPICFCQLTPASIETFGCGIHHLCDSCLAASARVQVCAGRVPRCFHPDCRAEIDPLVALRALEPEDHEHYLHLALWLNPRVEACPFCHAMLFAESIPARGTHATCPSCYRDFCTDCRGPPHAGAPCVARSLALGEASPTAAAQPSRQRPPRRSGSGISTGPHEAAADAGAAELRSLARRSGWKRCPRCQAVVEKADEDSCDHMTCVRCSHEFCWSCLADRRVIYAHGNHFHRPGCRHFASYNGPPEYRPERCERCRLRGSACLPAATGSQEAALARQSPELFVQRCYAVLSDTCQRLLESALAGTGGASAGGADRAASPQASAPAAARALRVP
eukprot:TRINITY_DN1665_c2_g1_i2.p1 TRINITY_DN1665_c2_g1~~TRINITY_DN1665_c2_g1_i2.p1  ORF type:complete len:559 (+),score=77.10 TRINITY_DN1665_c2_g1_i2:88-1677(+)